MRYLSSLFFIIIVLYSPTSLSQNNQIWLQPNLGQWEEQIDYKVDIANGDLFIENNQFTYHFYESPKKHTFEKSRKNKTSQNNSTIHGHVIKTKFLNCNRTNALQEIPSKHYLNYILGASPEKWKSNVHSYKKVTYPSFYPGIDLVIEGNETNLKYYFKAIPNSNIQVIQQKIEGANSIFISSNGDLHTTHDFGEIIEKKPIAWTEDEMGVKTNVPVEFYLQDEIVSYYFPIGYDSSKILIIDPDLIFSTFTGSTSDNWGFTAAPDKNGGIFAGGIIFGAGYPTSIGAYDINYHGGTNLNTIPGFDISISRYTNDGKEQIYGTYIGGMGNETPNSIICNSSNELFFFGTTGSSDFPITPNAYNKTFKGGSIFNNNEFTFNGTDIYVAKLSSDGTKLLASTFMGGSEQDGLNMGDLVFNYGDEFRGEIILTKEEDVLVVSSTQSSDFQTKQAFQNTLKGNQDAVLFKLSSGLDNLFWSSYFGGTGEETGNSVQISKNGDIYITGGTTSSDLTMKGGFQSSNLGGNGDTYIAKISGATPSLLNSTYFGSTAYDQGYFIQLDDQDDVYILGQTEGNIPITQGKYGIPNSGQYILKVANDLGSKKWVTTIGAGSGKVEISPTAFLVSNCSDIYITGWGGTVNGFLPGAKATSSSANNFPITPDAFQKTTGGDNFYLGVLSKDALSLKYGSYMGGITTSYNHVDGGTSRFDKEGGVYHAVCGGCGGQINGFTTTKGVYSETNNSTNCNLAAFKFDLNKAQAIVKASVDLVCVGDTIRFINTSTNADTYHWDFGDGNTSSEFEPYHLYLDTGKFQVEFIAINTKDCVKPDTSYLEVQIDSKYIYSTNPSITVCKGTEYQFNAPNGDAYNWIPSEKLNDNSIQNPKTIVNEQETYVLELNIGCQIEVISYPIDIFHDNITKSKDVELCFGESATLECNGGVTYQWSPTTYLDKTSGNSVVSTPDSTLTYQIDIKTINDCLDTQYIQVKVNYGDDKIIPNDSIQLCLGDEYELSMLTSTNINWKPYIWITPIDSNKVLFSPKKDVLYNLSYDNTCGSHQESLFIKVNSPNIQLLKDTSICEGDTATLVVLGGLQYNWGNPTDLGFKSGKDSAYVIPKQTTSYTVIVTDSNQCIDTVSATIFVYPKPKVITENQIHLSWGEYGILKAISNTKGIFEWKPNENISCVSCYQTTVNPTENKDYIVYFTDENGCNDTSIVHVKFASNIYIPNTFSPNNDTSNEYFHSTGYKIKDFEMQIFNRWGELIKTLNTIEETWDGTYKGLDCPDGTYVWKVNYVDNFGERHNLTGHVNLLR